MVNSPDQYRRWTLSVLAVVVILVVGRWAWSLMPPPQIGADEQVFNTVDALFTAITSRDNSRLAECEKRLQGCRQSGTLAAAPAQFLDGVIEQARRNEWEPAARRLYDFMYRQHRS